ncbi:hypothetical protein, conserved [Babesia bigemina]|uniref:Uncharacterized protein n=1 Tax=Babesia bigemina TaxID=5866 RepID=A0A061D409_BABBI|nr:hypothetical protein, conserved [Babesia bigemina]CDR95288.1 hypothetical protein, conserved [Babesia bigemina]|eukprot:XP_012767474.1 hypothetical protein, conserved [Babesia bigemina]
MVAVCGMCDASPGISTPIRSARWESRLGLLVAGTIEDPISVRSTASRCGCKRMCSKGECELSVGSFDNGGVPTHGMPRSAAGNASRRTPTCIMDRKPFECLGCVDLCTISTDEEDVVPCSTALGAPTMGAVDVGRPTADSIEWFKHKDAAVKHFFTPPPCTPAKKPKASTGMQCSKRRNSTSACVALPNLTSGGIDAETGVRNDTQSSDANCVAPPAKKYTSASTIKGTSGVQRPKAYRHKVLLRLRKKQPRNNYDLALFLLLKFGGTESAAGRSVLRDGALMECSALSRFRNEDELAVFYRNERTALMGMLSRRVAVSALSQSQLNRKLAKLLPSTRWFNRPKLLQKIVGQEHWNPFSIFGSSLPYVNVSEVFENNSRAASDRKPGCENASACTGDPDVRTDVSTSNVAAASNAAANPAADSRCVGHIVHTTPGINWSGDPLLLDEVLWYLEATDKYVDKSRQVCALQRCFCVTPNPQVAFNWNDARNLAWREYRGPRASMGQMLSPSTFGESMADYEKLRKEFESQSSQRDPGRQQDSTATDKSTKILNRGTGEELESTAPDVGGCSATVESSDNSASPTFANMPRTRQAKMQQLVFYRNYFKANRLEVERR